MRAVAALVALIHTSSAVTQAANQTATFQNGISFEALGSPESSEQHVMLALDDAAPDTCNAGPLNVLVRISDCFSVGEAKTLDTWVKSHLAAESSKLFSGGQPISFVYSAELEDDAGCTATLTWADVKDTTTFMSAPQGAVVPDAVITISKDAGTLADPAPAPSNHFKFRVGGTAAAGETHFDTIEALESSDAETNIYTIPCTSVPGSVAVPYTGADGKAQCVCKCPSGTALQNGHCALKAAAPTCTWELGHADTCSWASADATKTLVGGCGADVLIPKDNYVNDHRKNKNDNGANTPPNAAPKIEITGGPTTKSFAWNDYVQSPENSLNSIVFTDFGVYQLAMTASDYGLSATCSGCLAVVDDFTPEFATKFNQDTATVSDSTSDPTILDAETLGKAITEEGNYVSASQQSNFVNNAANPVQSTEVTTVATIVGSHPTTSTSGPCFDTNFIKHLLDDTAAKTKPTDFASLKCQRSCTRTLTLHESYKAYSCPDAVDPAATTRDGDSQTFSHFVSVDSSAIVTSTVSVSGGADGQSKDVLDAIAGATFTPGTNTIDRVCPDNDACTATETLSDLFTLSTVWANNIPGNPTLTAYNPEDYVFWRYKVEGTDVWNDWDSHATITFSSTNTKVWIQAFTNCGPATGVVQFEYVLHEVNEIATCNQFSSMWQQVSTNPLAHPTGYCAYPGSDFVPLFFEFSGKMATGAGVNPKFTGLYCTIKLADTQTNLDAATGVPLIDVAQATDGQPIFNYFGVELINSPTTEAATLAYLECNFKYQVVGNPDTLEKSCTKSLNLVDCSTPELDTALDVCEEDKCKGTTGQPGPGESCSGNVFKYSDALTAPKHADPLTCCDDCSATVTLGCTPIVDIPGVTIGRCEPTPQGGAAAVMMLADAEEDETEASSPVSAVLVGASALVALVALVAVKRRGTAMQVKTADNDAYYPLLE